MAALPDSAALLVVDVQEGIDHPRNGKRNNPDAEANIGRLLTAWRAAGRPVVHVQHHSTEPNSPLRPDRPGVAIKPIARPLNDEPVLRKSANSAFIGTDLTKRLRREGIDTLVVVGLTTDHCVSSTVRMAANLGYRTYLPGDATATHERMGPDGILYSADEMHRTALASLHGEFATVLSTDEMIAMTGGAGAESK
jgi:nicotinamidase-related amidase